jgi:hypothetical protein
VARLPVVLYEVTDGPSVSAADFTAVANARLERVRPRVQQANRAVFDTRIEAETFVEWLLARLGQVGGPQGRVSFHMCSHAEPGQVEPVTSCTVPDAELDVRAG